eukprot:SM000090S24360  [mRNA]  locus=s90:409565:412985:- [translate_table: standard]
MQIRVSEGRAAASGVGGLHAYVSRTLQALRPSSDPLKLKADSYLRQARDQVTLLRAYTAFARKAKLDFTRQVRLFEEQGANFTELLERPEYKALLTDPLTDSKDLQNLEKELKERMRMSKQIVMDAKDLFDNQLKIQKLKDTIFALNDQLNKAKKQGAFSSLIAAKSLPKSLNCIGMRLMEELVANPELYKREDKPRSEWEDPSLYHYAIFSDNVVAASVVVNSAVQNAKEPELHVFHVVTDKLNLGAMLVWFKKRPLSGAHIEVRAVEDYKFLNSSYVPVLKQLESANLQKFYFENKMENATKDSSNLKFRNPKQNEDRLLWKLGTLPPGLITFYKTTKPLDKSWHVLGLGYNPNINLEKVKAAAVIHYNGNMKPWLDLAMHQYRGFWTKYVDYEMEYMQACNFN